MCVISQEKGVVVALKTYICEFIVSGSQAGFTKANSFKEAKKKFENGDFEFEEEPDLDQMEMLEDTIEEYKK